MTHKNRSIVIATALFVSMSAVPAFANGDKDTARSVLIQGHELFQRGQYREALGQILTSWSLVKMPYTALWAARANEKLGRLVDAARMYREAISSKQDDSWPTEPQKVQAQKQAQKDAQTELDALLPRIPTLKVETIGGNSAELDITIGVTRLTGDVAMTPQQLDPGNHTVIATAKDGQTLTETVTLAEKDRKSVTFDLAKLQQSPEPPIAKAESPVAIVSTGAAVSPPRGDVAPQQPEEGMAQRKLPTIGWIGVGVGAAGLAVGATAGVVAWAKLDKAEEVGCDSNHECADAVYDRYGKSYNNWRTASTVGFIAGGVGAAVAGITWLVAVPKREAGPPVSMTIGPGTVGVHGVF